METAEQRVQSHKRHRLQGTDLVREGSLGITLGKTDSGASFKPPRRMDVGSQQRAATWFRSQCASASDVLLPTVSSNGHADVNGVQPSGRHAPQYEGSPMDDGESSDLASPMDRDVSHQLDRRRAGEDDIYAQPSDGPDGGFRVGCVRLCLIAVISLM